MATSTCYEPVRLVCSAFHRFLCWKRPRNARKVASDSRKREAQAEWDRLIRMCGNVPPAPANKGSKFRSLAFSLGLGGTSSNVPHGVRSLHDLAARLINEKEVTRLGKCKKESLGFVTPWIVLNGDTQQCFPFSLLRGRCVLVVNTASR